MIRLRYGVRTVSGLLLLRTVWEPGRLHCGQRRRRTTTLTTHSGSETPLAFTDAGHVLFSAGIMPSAEAVVFPFNGQFNQVYRVSVEGGADDDFVHAYGVHLHQ